MKIDGALGIEELSGVPERVRQLESAGYDGAVSAEIANDPFLPLALAADHSQRIELLTSIAVAFARTPMLVAQTGHDLNAFAKGRVILGLGSQVRPHVTRRFSMPWSRPAARMREFVLAMRAIWDCWYEGNALDFRGEFYTHTLMTPNFTPTNRGFGPPRVFVAGVGPLMTEVAGEVADGLITHAFTTEKYVREVTLPALERGLEKAGRGRDDFEITCPVFVVTGDDEREFEARREALRKQLAFYASTPAYRGVLEVHGWGDLQPELTRMSKLGQWDEMGELVDDSMLEAFAVVAEKEDLASKLRARCDGFVDRLMCTFSMGKNERETLAALR
ncbi:LLM class F420-dependent oxidoreductase [Myxococcota bacterium]|nr:LLM class F420-dependent oxidoreductase [Myxococcota bacterium]